MSKNNPRIKTKLLKSWKTSDIRIESNSKGNWVVLGKKRVELPKGVVGGRMILKEAEGLLGLTSNERSSVHYTDKEKELMIESILNQISFNGLSVNKIFDKSNELHPGVSRKVFFEWLKNDEELVNNYARACEARADLIFDELLEIADDSSQDTIEMDLGDGIVVEKQNHEFVNRSKVRIDTRKWILSKMNPKKYGDKIDHTTNGETIIQPARILTKQEAKGLLNDLENEY